MAKRTRWPALRIGDPVPPDAVEWLQVFNAMPPERQRAVADCARLPLRRRGLSGYEQIRRLALALGIRRLTLRPSLHRYGTVTCISSDLTIPPATEGPLREGRPFRWTGRNASGGCRTTAQPLRSPAAR